MSEITHLTLPELEAALDQLRASPRELGTVELIVRRPAVNEREVLHEGVLDVAQGLVGDNWLPRGYRKRDDRSAHPDMQLNVMNARAAQLVAGSRERWALAGDQLYVDLDLSGANLPAGTRLQVGEAVIEVTAEPHTGCSKFVSRFGAAAMKFVNSPVGRELNLRGINAKVVVGGVVRVGDGVRKVVGG